MLCWLAGDTRFYTEYIAGNRVLEVRSALQETAVSAEFTAWAEKQSYKQEAMKVKKLILDEDWWEDLILMDKLFKPIVKLLKLVDSDLPSMGKVKHSSQCLAREPGLLSSCMGM